MRYFLLTFLFIGIACSSEEQVTESKTKKQPDPVVQNDSLTDPLAIRLKDHVHALVYTEAPRDYDSPGLEEAAQYIETIFREFTANVSSQPFEVEGAPYRNIVCELGDKSLPTVVIGAHYDSCEELPGADDNASGVAGLIELGRLLSADTALPYHYELVAYTLEEPPFFRTEHMGSYHHATTLKYSDIDVKAMISLEMIGYYSDAPGSQEYPIPELEQMYPDKGNFILVAGRDQDAALVNALDEVMSARCTTDVQQIIAPPQLQGMDFSDHLNYWEAGITAAMITNTAFYRNKAYHTAQDTPDRLNYNKMADVIKGLHGALLQLK